MIAAAAAAQSPVVLRDAEQATKLEAVLATGACDQGGVVVLDFQAIRAGMGARWPSRRHDVQDRIERAIARHVARSSICVPIGECEYLICFAEERGALAHVTAFQIMEDLLSHFLGRCAPEDLLVKRVTSLAAGEIRMEALDRGQVEGARKRELDTAQTAPARPRLVTGLIEGPAERLSVRLSPQEIVHIPTGVTIGQRLAIALQRIGSSRVLTAAEEIQLSTNGLIETSLMAADALQTVMASSKQAGAFSLPVFLPGLVNSRGRTAFIDILRGFSGHDQRRLLIEIVGIERGTPASRVMEAATSVRPFCRAVIGRGAFSRSGLESLASARLSGVSLSAKELGSGEFQLASGLLAAGQAARKIAPMVLATDIDKPELLSICSVAGFSHAAIVV